MGPEGGGLCGAEAACAARAACVCMRSPHGWRTLMSASCMLMPTHPCASIALQGVVSPGWFHTHIVVQLLALLCAFAGFVIAILAFGWKTMPQLALYAPHKWMGIVVTGMALLQLLLAPVRPKLGAKARPAWNLVHHSLGRVTTLAGIANVFIGIVLLHDFKVGRRRCRVGPPPPCFSCWHSEGGAAHCASAPRPFLRACYITERAACLHGTLVLDRHFQPPPIPHPPPFLLFHTPKSTHPATDPPHRMSPTSIG